MRGPAAVGLDRSPAFARALFTPLASRYDLLGAVLSFGQDRRWRAAALDHLDAGAGSLVLDVATGPGGVARALRRRMGAAVVGMDLTEAMVRRASRNEANSGVRFLVGDARRLPFADRSFDAVSFTYLLRYVEDPAATMRELARVLRPGGTVTSLEFFVPQCAPWRPLWWCYTRLVLPAAGALLGGRSWYKVGRFLGPSIEAHWSAHPLSWMMQAWREAGLDEVGARVMSLGGGVVMWGRKAHDGD